MFKQLLSHISISGFRFVLVNWTSWSTKSTSPLQKLLVSDGLLYISANFEPCWRSSPCPYDRLWTKTCSAVPRTVCAGPGLSLLYSFFQTVHMSHCITKGGLWHDIILVRREFYDVHAVYLSFYTKPESYEWLTIINLINEEYDSKYVKYWRNKFTFEILTKEMNFWFWYPHQQSCRGIYWFHHGCLLCVHPSVYLWKSGFCMINSFYFWLTMIILHTCWPWPEEDL